MAATWTPYDVSVPITWAALDCSGGWAIRHRGAAAGARHHLAAPRRPPPATGVRHVVVGELRGGEGRKTYTASTLYDPDGAVLATAEHVWIAIDPQDFS